MDIKELKIRKKNLKLTTAQLAYMAELPLGTVSKIMTGETKNPSYITIEKLDKALCREEMRDRIEAYQCYLSEYAKQHLGEEIDAREVEKKYREEYKLTDDPIPYAVPMDGQEVSSNTAAVIEKKATIEMLSEYGEIRNVELLDGEIVVNEVPAIKHHRLVKKLGRQIDRYIDDNQGECEAFAVGVNVRLDPRDKHSMLIPDIAVVCNPKIVKEDAIWGAPDWVLEVVSPITRHRDYNDKLHKYMSCGVREYWIVDPDKEMVTTYITGEPIMSKIYGFDEEIPVAIYDDKLKIRIND